MWVFAPLTWRVWGRHRDTNQYVEIDVVDKPMDRFKHEVYAFSMDKRHREMKCLYLYQGYRRIAKATVEDLRLIITFRSRAWAESFDHASEQISRIPCFFSWLEKDFEGMWKSITDKHYERRYKLVKCIK